MGRCERETAIFPCPHAPGWSPRLLKTTRGNSHRANQVTQFENELGKEPRMRDSLSQVMGIKIHHHLRKKKKVLKFVEDTPISSCYGQKFRCTTCLRRSFHSCRKQQDACSWGAVLCSAAADPCGPISRIRPWSHLSSAQWWTPPLSVSQFTCLYLFTYLRTSIMVAFGYGAFRFVRT